MLKTAVAFAVVMGLPLIFPGCSCASDPEKPGNSPISPGTNTKMHDHVNAEAWARSALRGTPEDSDKGCDGKSVEDFLKGKCNKLNGYDARPRHLQHAKDPEWFKESGGHGWKVRGEESSTVIPRFFEFHQSVPPGFGIEKPDQNQFKGSPGPKLKE